MTAIDAFADDLLYRMLVLSPDLAAEMGLEAVGARVLPQHAVPDFSDEASDSRTSMMAERAEALSRFPAAGLVGEDAITYRVLDYVLEDGLFGMFRGRSGHRFVDNPYPVNHLTGHHPLVLMMLTRDAVIRDTGDAEDHLARLAALPDLVVGVEAALKARLAEGIVTPRFALAHSLADMKTFISPPPDENILVASFEGKLKAAGLDDAVHMRVLAQAVRLVAREIVPAYTRLIAATQDAIDAAGEERGVWSLPSGDGYYEWLLRAHTTTELTPDKAHDIGKDEIGRVQAAIRTAFAKIGIHADGIAELYAQISVGPRFRYSPDERGRTEIWSDATRLMQRFESGGVELFARFRAAAWNL